MRLPVQIDVSSITDSYGGTLLFLPSGYDLDGVCVCVFYYLPTHDIILEIPTKLVPFFSREM